MASLILHRDGQPWKHSSIELMIHQWRRKMEKLSSDDEHLCSIFELLPEPIIEISPPGKAQMKSTPLGKTMALSL